MEPAPVPLVPAITIWSTSRAGLIPVFSSSSRSASGLMPRCEA